MTQHKRFGIWLLMAIFLGHATASAQDTPAASLALVGGQLVDGYGGRPLQNSVVLISDDRIVAVGELGTLAVPTSAEVIDTNGMSILPGLWESHGHLFHVGEGDPGDFPKTFQAQATEVMAAVAKISLLSGITTFRDTGGPIAEQLALRADIDSGKLPGPRLFLAGPILSQSTSGSPPRNQDYLINSVETARQATRKVIALGVDQIKVYGFWDLDILRAVTSTAHEAGLGVDADVRHITAYRTAIEAGVDRLHHVFTADALSDYDADDIRLLVRGIRPGAAGPMANILRGPYIIPTIEMRQAYARAFEFPELLDHPAIAQQYPDDVYRHLRSTWENPSSIAWGIGAPERVKVAKRKLAHFVDAGGREQIVAGTDAGSPLNLHSPLRRELRHLEAAGLTPMEVIQSATLRAAQMQGAEQELGTVTAGKFADIIIVDGDPLQDISVLEHKLVMVIRGGKIFPID